MQPINFAGMLDMNALRWGDNLQQGLLAGQQMQANKMAMQKDQQMQQQQAQAMGMLQRNPNDQQAMGMLALSNPQAANAYGNTLAQGLERRQMEQQIQTAKQEELKNQMYFASKTLEQTPPEQAPQVYNAMVKEWEANGVPLPEPLKTYSPQNLAHLKDWGSTSNAFKAQQEAEKERLSQEKTKADIGNIAFEQGYKKQTSNRDYELKKQELELKRQEADVKKQEAIVKRMEATNKPLSSEAAKTIGLIESGLQSVGELRGKKAPMGADVGSSGLVGGIIDKFQGADVKQYRAARDNLADVIGRLRSGGAIGQDEEKRYLSLLPRATDDKKTQEIKLNKITQDLNIIGSAMKSVQPQPIQATGGQSVNLPTGFILD